MRQLIFLLLAIVGGLVYADDGARFALVVGNSDYTSVTKLRNPVNDASDMADVLKGLGFKVELLKNATLNEMDNAVVRLGNNLGQSKGSYGFFFYAGHGVQSNGVNYLLPVDTSIPSESFLKSRALSAQDLLDTLQQAGNGLNIVVLDACRDNPFGWGRTTNRGLTPVSSQPPGSIIVYSTSAGATALDGTGRNGLFTSQLLKNLKTPGLEIKDVFNTTGNDVMTASDNHQVPAVFVQFFKKAYLAGGPGSVAATIPLSPTNAGTLTFGTVSVQPGYLTITAATAGTLEIRGQRIDLPAGGTVPINDLSPGDYTLSMSYADGTAESKSITVVSGQNQAIGFGQSARTADAVPPVASPNNKDASHSTGTLSSTWVPGTLPFTNRFPNFVAYGNGVFVAICSESNEAATSADGVHWSRRILPSSQGWDSICFGNGTFVAVSQSDVAAVSTDGIAWTKGRLPGWHVWSSVTFGDGTFVAVARKSNVAATSVDGINWTSSSLTSDEAWTSVTYGNGTFLAVCYHSDSVATSPDGVTWASGRIPRSEWWSAVSFGNGVFVAISSEECAISVDGTRWSIGSLPGRGGWSSIAYGKGIFVATDFSGSSVASSADGLNWVVNKLPKAEALWSITFGDSTFVALSDQDSLAAAVE